MKQRMIHRSKSHLYGASKLKLFVLAKLREFNETFPEDGLRLKDINKKIEMSRQSLHYYLNRLCKCGKITKFRRHIGNQFMYRVSSE